MEARSSDKVLSGYDLFPLTDTGFYLLVAVLIFTFCRSKFVFAGYKLIEFVVKLKFCRYSAAFSAYMRKAASFANAYIVAGFGRFVLVKGCIYPLGFLEQAFGIFIVKRHLDEFSLTGELVRQCEKCVLFSEVIHIDLKLRRIAADVCALAVKKVLDTVKLIPLYRRKPLDLDRDQFAGLRIFNAYVFAPGDIRLLDLPAVLRGRYDLKPRPLDILDGKILNAVAEVENGL